MLPLVLLLLAQPVSDSRVTRVERVPGGRAEGGRGGVKGWAFFEAFPVGGAGTTTACSTTAPTGAKGETLTFTRTGNATCLKQGPATTGIANGDLVLLSADVPRVSSVAGLLAFLRESARTNLQLRSQELDNVVWGRTAGGGASAPTIPSINSTAPDNYSTADRLSFSACPTVGDYSQLAQLVSASATTYSNSIFVRAVSGSATVSLCGFGATGVCTQCTATDTAWTWCQLNAWTAAASAYLVVGCINNTAAYTGATNTGAADVYLWNAQMELGAWASTPIATSAAAVTRNADSAMSVTLASSVGTSFSLGASSSYLSSSVTTATAAQLGTSAPNLASVGRNSNTAAAFTINATSTTPAVSAQSTSMLRGCLTDAAGTRTAWWDGSTVSAPASSMSAGVTALSFGALDAYTARVLVDPSPTRCP